MISYELSYGLALAAVLVMAQLAVAAGDRQRAGRLALVRRASPRWFVFLQPIGFSIYMIAGHRRDQPRAVRLSRGRAGARGRVPHRVQLDELRAVLPRGVREHGHGVGGRHQPVSRRLALPLLPEWLRLRCWFAAQGRAILFFYLWLRWTMPRFRYDQLMAFGWKVLLPLAVFNLLVTAAGVLYFGP